MAETKKSKRKIFSDYSDLTIFVVVLLIVTLGVVVWLFTNLTNEISRHKTLENQSNQACLGISIASNSGVGIDTDTLYATSTLLEKSTVQATANQRCIVGGQSTENETPHGKKIASYSFGSEVIYFETSEAAENYAETKLNPLRYWSPDATNTNYTFIVQSSGIIYFDSYSVKDNVVMRISLPCNESDNSENESTKECALQADRTISIFNKKLSPLNL